MRNIIALTNATFNGLFWTAEETGVEVVEASNPLVTILKFLLSSLVVILIAALIVALITTWIANIFALVRAVKTNNTTLVTLHAVGVIVGLLGSILGAIYLLKWRKEPPIGRQDSKPNNSFNVADELGKLSVLRDQGVITNEDFELQKGKLLGN